MISRTPRSCTRSRQPVSIAGKSGSRRSIADQRGAPLVEQVRQREHQPLPAVVQPLSRATEQRRQIGQPAFRARQPQPALLGQAVQPADQPRRLVFQIGDQIGARRHREFRRRGRGRRAPVGDEIDQRGVGLVPHRGDQRDAACGDGAQRRPPR